jgi:hypothetical protein
MIVDASEVSDSTNSTLAIPPNKESGDIGWFLKRKRSTSKELTEMTTTKEEQRYN